MNKDQALKEMLDLRRTWAVKQHHSEADGNSDYATYNGAIKAIDVVMKIVKEID